MLNHTGRFFVLLLILLALAASFVNRRSLAQNDESGVEMLARAGFGGLDVSYGGGWVPFRIQVTNQGAAISGRLIVVSKTSPNQGSQGREFVKDVQLPTGARQLHEITAYLNSNEDVDVNLVSQGKVVATTTIKVERQSGYGNDSMQLAVVDNDSTALNNISALQLVANPNRLPFEKVTLQNTPQQNQANDPNQNNQQAQQQNNQRNRNRYGYAPQPPTVRPTVIPPEDLPRDFVSYDPVDVVIINDAPLNQLNEDQARALKDWVASGGLLIVTGGTDITGLHASGVDAILPVETQGSITIAAIPELTDTYGAFEGKDQLLVMAAKTKPGARTIIGTNEHAIVAESKYGSGLVRFVAFNPKLNPYRGWGAGKYLWLDLLTSATNLRANQYPGRRSYRNNMWGLQNFLFNLAKIKPASPNILLFFLLFYVVTVGPLNYFALKWMKKLDLAWITIPAVVLLFTVLSIVFAQFNRTGTVASDAMAVEVYQGENVTLINGGILIKSDSDATQEIKLDSRDAYANDIQQAGPPSGRSEAIEAVREPARFILRVPSTNGVADIFNVRTMGELKSPLLSAVEAGAGAVKIRNLSDAEINNAVFINSGGISDIFTLAPGEEKQVALNTPQAMPFWNWYTNQLSSTPEFNDVLDALSANFDRGAAKNNSKLQDFLDRGLMTDTYKALERPMLLGFIDSSAAKIEVGNSPKRGSKSVYLVHL